MRVVFNKVKVKNFLSFGEKPGELCYSPGLTFVSGYNEDKQSNNGVGKTTLLVESISFALFGDTHRKIKQSKIIHKRSKGPCEVELEFSIEKDYYKVIRTLKPNKLLFYKNNEDLSKTINETEKEIQKVLGVSQSIFNHTLVMTNNSKNSFISQSKDLKTKFIEGILSLECFSDIFSSAKEQASSASKDLVKKETIYNSAIKNLQNLQNYADEEEQARKIELNKIQRDIDNRRNSTFIVSDILDEMTKIKDSIKNRITEQRELSDKIIKANNKKVKFQSIVLSLENKLKDLTEKNKICPSCKRPLNEHDKAEIENEKNIVKQELLEKKNEYDLFISKIRKAETKLSRHSSDIKTDESKLKKLEADLSDANLQQQILRLKQEEYEQCLNKPNTFFGKIEKHKNDIDEYKISFDAAVEEDLICEAVKFVASSQGVKTVIVDKILGTLNDRLAYYLNRLESPYSCIFDEFFEEKITDSRGDEVSYGNASGGEAVRIDFALMFAFRDIRKMQSGISLNISVFDELFDSAIDSKGQEEIQSMLKEMAEENDDCFYIVTHRPDAIPSDATYLKLRKKDDVTFIENTI